MVMGVMMTDSLNALPTVYEIVVMSSSNNDNNNKKVCG